MKEILLYGDVYDYTAAQFIQAINDAGSSAVTLRINSRGGSPESMYGMAAKWGEYKGRKKTLTDAKAHSAAAFLLCYSDDNECHDISEFIIHRAAYPKWFEDDANFMTDDVRAGLKRRNDNLRAALEAKIDVAKFEQLKGVTLDQVFSMDSRIDVTLTAQEALAVGLVNKVVTLTPQRRIQVNAMVMQMAATAEQKAEWLLPEPQAQQQQTVENLNQHTMTLEQLKAQHPDTYKAAYGEGVTDERDRVEAFMAYADVDLKGVTEGIQKGDKLTAKMQAELGRKMLAKGMATAMKEETPGAITTEEVETEAAADTKDKNPKVEAFGARLDELLKK